MALEIRLVGAEEAIRLLEAADRAVHAPRRPLLRVIGEQLRAALQENIRTGGTRLSGEGITWPPLATVTEKIRAHYGHTQGPLVRSRADLLNSIGVLRVDESSVEVGAPGEIARIVNFGGTATSGKVFVPREVPARPFAAWTEQDLDDVVESLLLALEEELAA